MQRSTHPEKEFCTSYRKNDDGSKDFGCPCCRSANGCFVRSRCRSCSFVVGCSGQFLDQSAQFFGPDPMTIHMSSKAFSIKVFRSSVGLSPSELTSLPSVVNVFHAPRRPPRAKYPSTNSMEVTFASESSKPDGMLNLSTSWLTDAKRLSKSATSRKKIFLRRVSPGRMSCPLQLDFWHSVEPLMPLSQQES